jgi:hypothetical protein
MKREHKQFRRIERDDRAAFWMGVGALMLQANPALSPDDIEQILLASGGDPVRAVELADALRST